MTWSKKKTNQKFDVLLTRFLIATASYSELAHSLWPIGTYVEVIAHMCRLSSHMWRLSSHMCRLSSHMWRYIITYVTVYHHICDGISSHMCRLSSHMWRLSSHMCWRIITYVTVYHHICDGISSHMWRLSSHMWRLLSHMWWRIYQIIDKGWSIILWYSDETTNIRRGRRPSWIFFGEAEY